MNKSLPKLEIQSINLRRHQETNTSGFLTDRELENLRGWSFYSQMSFISFLAESPYAPKITVNTVIVPINCPFTPLPIAQGR